MSEPLSEQQILVVDDTPANLDVLSETLTAAGYTVATAINGERALKRIQIYRPDLILLDVMMPGIDGFETCQQMKAIPAIANVPVIFMTALADVSSKVKGFSIGAVDYITKPFQERELLARVGTHLQLRALTQNLEQKVADQTAALKLTLEQLQESQMQLVQSEKMSALGNLIAGIAHEINNPVGFISGNLHPAQQYLTDLLKLITLYQVELPHPSETLQQYVDAIDLDYIREDFPELLSSMKLGVDRIQQITNGLRTFSRLDSDRPVSTDLHEGIDSTLMLLKHRVRGNDWRDEIAISRDYGSIPLVECYAGQLNQVFMNILANAIDAIDEASYQAKQAEERLCSQTQSHQITIRTRFLEEVQRVQIQIEDTGLGIPPENQHKIFDYLFTTKQIGKGTGLGLTIVRQIVTEKHHGIIQMHSEMGWGTRFSIEIPLRVPVPTCSFSNAVGG